ncbi:oac-46, partial [Pristionchus pacificus]
AGPVMGRWWSSVVAARAAVTVLIALSIAVRAELNFYTEKQVLRFINASATHTELSADCRNALLRVEPYLKDQETLEAQRIFFSQSYASGISDLFLSRDQDRWIYRGYECILSAGETVFSRSEHPMHYCYGYNEDDPKTDAYSVCIPSPCANDHVKLIELWRKMARKALAPETKPIDFSACTQSRHEKQWFEKPVPIIDFTMNQLAILFIVLATVFHYKRGEEVKTLPAQLLLAFSARKNLRKLCELPKDPQATLTCMFGLRFLAMVWTLVGHSFIFIQAYIENVDDFKNDLVDNFYNQYITNFTLSVDAFLMLGGTVLSYSWFRKWLKNNNEPEPTWTSYGFWLRFYRHRLVRLWPAYLYTLTAVTLRISITHFHPMWPPTDPGVQCPIHWWENVFFLNSLFDNRCMPWTWYIGTEFIYYLLSPIFLLALRKSVKLGALVCFTAIAISAGFNTYSIIENNFPPTQFLWKQPAIFNPNFIQHHIELYIKPHFRIGPYIIGIMLGYYLAFFQRKAIKPERTPTFVATGWALSAAAGFWAIFGLYPSLQGWDWPVYHVIYGTIHRDVFAIALAWLVYACHTGIGGPINALLSLKPLLPLSNLCYSVYLFHMIPVVLTYLLTSFPMWYTTKMTIFAHCLVQLFISYLFAMLCVLVAEYPALNIERLLLHPPATKTTIKTVPTSDSEMQLRPDEASSIASTPTRD